MRGWGGGGGRGVLAHAGHQRMVDDADADLHLLGFTTKLCESRPGEGLAQSRMGARGGVEWGEIKHGVRVGAGVEPT